MVKNKALICSVLLVMAMTASAFATVQTVTIASFADPSNNSSEPLFTVDYANGIIYGGWTGSGLTLLAPAIGDFYDNVTFTMTQMTFSANAEGDYFTESGVIRFSEGDNEVLTIEFDKLHIHGRDSGLNAQSVYGDNVRFSGQDIGNHTDQQFGFTFANVVTEDDVVTATASFTSSAAPEPATMFLLGIGGLLLRKRK